MSPHPLLLAVFEAFDAANVRWCLLRGEADLAAPDDDVDILVDRDDLGMVQHVLAHLAFVTLPSWGRGSHHFFLSYHTETGQWIHLDIVTELAYGPQFALQLDAAHACLLNRQRKGAITTLAPDEAFWVFLLHRLLDKGVINAASAARLRELAMIATTMSPVAVAIEHSGPTAWTAERLLCAARAEDWRTLECAGRRIAVAWRRQRPLTVGSRAVINRALRLLEVPHRAFFRRGLSVALLGPDGAGKSTLAASITNSFYFPVQLVYMGLWKERPVRRWGRMLPSLPGWNAIHRLLLAWWRYLTGLYHRMRGHLVIFDRYTYDALLPPHHTVTCLSKLYVWLLAHACPAPDHVLLLDAPGEVMYARKGEFDPAHLERERHDFLALATHIPDMQIVDNTRAQEDVRAEVITRIWQRHLLQWNGSL